MADSEGTGSGSGEEPDDAKPAPSAEEAPPRPTFTDTISDLKHTTMMVGHGLDATFGVEGREHLEHDPLGWLVRVHGSGIGHHVADALRVATIIEHLAKSVRWIGNGLYPGQGVVPGLAVARAGNSIVLHFTAGLKEEPVAIGAERDEYVSLAGGEYMAAIMAASADEERVAGLIGPLGRRAVGVYAGTLDDLVTKEIGLNLILPVREPGARRLEAVRVDITPEEAVEDLRFLRREPRMVRRTEQRTGVLFALNDKSGRFSLTDEDSKEDVTGTMTQEVRDKLGPVWRKRVTATIEVTEPEYDWLPRARGATRRLIDAEAAPRRRR